MTVRKRDLDRRFVIEAYARYDCLKKNCPTPDFTTWDWSEPDLIDRQMERANLKTGVLAGYVQWDMVELTIPDLRECAVVAGIFPGFSRKLGVIETTGVLINWTPNVQTPWYPHIASGQPIDERAPLILRPAVRAEYPARWYVEDGSGRAVAFVANQIRFDASQTVAFAYLGRQPDPRSSFLNQRLPDLLSA